MYQYQLKISCFSKQNRLQEIVESVTPFEKFTHQVKTFDKVNLDAIKNSDVILWDLSDVDVLEKCVSDQTKVILFAKEYLDSFDQYDEVVIGQIQESFLEKKIKRVLEKIALEEELQFTKSCLQTAVDGSPDMFWMKTLDGTHMLLNDAFCEVVGKTKQEVTGQDHYTIWDVSKDDPNTGADLCKQTEDAVISVKHMLSFAESVKSKGETRQLITYKSPVYDKFGNIIGTVGYGHDITDLKNLSEENSILLNSMPYAVLLKNKEGVIESINIAFETYFMVNKGDVIGQNYAEWAQKTFYEERTLNNEGFKEGKTHPINGEEKIAELREKDICDIYGNITGQVCIFRDVTLERKLEEQITQTANIDFMTKLYNRRYLDQFIYDQSGRTSLSILSVDLDHFKNVNDTYGHKAGDEAIILAANVMKECCPNDLIVRMGGDEFLIVKKGDCSEEEIQEEAERLLTAFREAFHRNPKFQLLSASIGISQGILGDIGIDALLQRCDFALYQAKEKGRNCCAIYEFSPKTFMKI